MTAIAKPDVRAARQRAGKIREGIHNYLETLALIQQAWADRDWEILGYDTWDQYVETEFSEARLHLPSEHRQKAVTELRLAGMSQRAIGSALGIPQTRVSRDLATESDESVAASDLPATVVSLDGRSRPATQSPRRTRNDIRPTVEPDADQPERYTDQAEVPTPGLAVGVADDEADGVPVVPTAGESFLPTDASTVAPSPAVTEFLGADESLQRAQYLHEFMKVLTRSDDFMEFDAEKLAELSDLELVETLKNYLTRVSNFVERFHKARQARGGLRLISGGAR